MAIFVFASKTHVVGALGSADVDIPFSRDANASLSASEVEKNSNKLVTKRSPVQYAVISY